MHEERNLEVVKDVYAAFGRGDLPGVSEALADDVQWRWYGPSSIPFAGSWDGRARATEWLTMVASMLDFHAWEQREFYAQGDTVVVLGYEDATVKATGQRYEQQWVHFFTVQGDQVMRFRQFSDTAAIAAAYEGALAPTAD